MEEYKFEKIDLEISDYRKKILVRLQNYYKYLRYNDEKDREILEAIDEEYFIPQFWWGDVSNTGPMKAVILGNNPSLRIKGKINDLSDLFKDDIRNKLELNIKLSNRNNEINNVLINCDNAYFSKWCSNCFKDIKNFNDFTGVAIYNLFGFYSKSFPDDLDIEESHISIIPDIKNNILNQIEKSKIIILLWKSSWKNWRKVLDYENNKDKFKNKEIYVVNELSQVNTNILKAIPMPIELLEKMYKDEEIKKREEYIKEIF